MRTFEIGGFVKGWRPLTKPPLRVDLCFIYSSRSFIWLEELPGADRMSRRHRSALCGAPAPCYLMSMLKYTGIAATLALGMMVPSAAQESIPAYDYRERTRVLAFDPARFFPERAQPAMSVRYLGDDYAYPVYTIAVREGCTSEDQGEARKTCGKRLVARMVRSSFQGTPPRERARGQRLFAAIARSQPQSDEALLQSLDNAELEWLEADVRACPSAMAHLRTGRDLLFSSIIDRTDQTEIVLHADKVIFEISNYLQKSHYEGWLKPGSPGAWANAFAASLETCWKPSKAIVPWRVTKR